MYHQVPPGTVVKRNATLNSQLQSMRLHTQNDMIGGTKISQCKKTTKNSGILSNLIGSLMK